MNLTRIDTIVQFTLGTSTIWNNASVAVPAGAIVVDTVNKIIKEGDGATLFENLPVCLDYNFHSNTSGALIPEGDNVGAVAISDDSVYSYSGVKLEDILTSITNLNTKSAAQQSDINDATLNAVVAEVSEGVVDGTYVICQSGQYVPGDKTLTQLIADLAALMNNINARMHITDLEWYSDSGLVNKVVKPNLVSENNTYWCKVTGFHDNAELKNVDFSLASTNENVTITTSQDEVTSAFILKMISPTGTSGEFTKVIQDSSYGLIAVGTYTVSNVQYGYIAKLDKDLNVTRSIKLSYFSVINDIKIDSNGNIFVVGKYQNTSEGGTDAMIAKLTNNLTLVACYQCDYASASNEEFYALAIDSSNSVYAVGYYGTYQFLVKFDYNLNLLYQRYYYITASGGTFNSIAVDSSGNLYAVGKYKTAASASDNFIIKFDSTLTYVTGRRWYYSTSTVEYFNYVKIDNDGNIFAVGSTGTGKPIVVKFDSSLTVVNSIIFTNTGTFNDLIVDDNNVYVVGSNYENSLTGGFLVKFDKSLNIVSSSFFQKTSDIVTFSGLCFGFNDAIVIAGLVGSWCCILKISKDIPSGTLNATNLNITKTDSATASSVWSYSTAAVTIGSTYTTGMTATSNSISITDVAYSVTDDVIAAARYIDPTKLITNVYTSTEEDKFIANTIDSEGNIIAIGSTIVSGTQNALIVKFDSDFNVIARKLYSGNFSQYFNSVVTDASNNIVAVGGFTTASGGANEAFIVKFDSSLTNIIIQKTYGATGDDVFNDITIDPSGNFIVVGYTTSEGSGLKDGLIVKFNPTLNVVYKKRYGGTGNDILISVAVDVNGNALCVGSTGSEGANTSGLILKLDSNLNIVLRKYYNSTLGTATIFNSVVVTAANVVYVVGYVTIVSGNKGLIVKLDSSLNSTGSKLYGNDVGGTEFTGVKLDSSTNVIVAGKTNAEGAGNYDALIMKFSSLLAILGRKTYGTIGEDADIDCDVDSNDDIILSGYSVINGSTDAMITKMPNNLPSGLYTNKYLTDLILSDSKLTLIDDASTVGNSTTAMADSTLILSNGTMSLSNAGGGVVKDITIMDAINNVFKVQFGDIVETSNGSVEFIVTTDDGDDVVTKNISVDIAPTNLLTLVYGGGSDDFFYKVTIDSSNNIYAVGETKSEGGSAGDALIVKLDTSFNILARKHYGGVTGEDLFNDIAIDKNDNIYAVGVTASEGSGSSDALIVKFDTSLNITARKVYGGTGAESFLGVNIDNSNNIYAVGHTTSDGGSITSALIVKFDSNLTTLFRKYYGGSSSEQFYQVAFDSSNNVYTIGFTASSGTSGGADWVILKLDSSGTILVQKFYGGTGTDYSQGIAVDSNDNIYVVGYNSSEGTNTSATIIKFDTSLNKIAGKYYSGSGVDLFYAIAIDSNDNIYTVGSTTSAGIGSTETFIVKWNTSLEVIFSKYYGGTGIEYLKGVETDNSGNVYAVGYTNSEGSGIYDALIVRMTQDTFTGTFSGTVLTNLILGDVIYTEIDSNLTLNTGTFTAANSLLTLADSALTLTDSALSYEIDLIN